MASGDACSYTLRLNDTTADHQCRRAAISGEGPRVVSERQAPADSPGAGALAPGGAVPARRPFVATGLAREPRGDRLRRGREDVRRVRPVELSPAALDRGKGVLPAREPAGAERRG